MRWRSIVVGMVVALGIGACGRSADPPGVRHDDGAAAGGGVGSLVGEDDRTAVWGAVPQLEARERRFEAVAGEKPPILRREGLEADAERAQAIALGDARMGAAVVDADSGRSMRAEVMGVRELVPGDLGSGAPACGACWRVEVYNHVSHASFVVLVDLGAGRVVEFRTQANAQPELPAELGDLAARIAVNSPAVAQELGFQPGLDAAGMPGVKSALEGSDCERSRHLCVAPTFRLEGRALWAIVDLTEGRVVGTRWTDLGRGEAVRITEQSLQDEVVMARYCQQVNHLERGGWTMDYLLTPSDGLEVRDLRFEGRPVLASAKLVDWHVSYSREEGFGYSDATGCPQFSSASVVAFDGPSVDSIPARGDDPGAAEAGFALVQDFRSEQWPMPCNYRYVQRFEFHSDGGLQVGGANIGRGCGNDGTYRPVLRIQPAQEGMERLERWEAGSGWQRVEEEGFWSAEGLGLDEAGRMLRWMDDQGAGYAMLPSLDDGGWIYLSDSKVEEGEGDLLTIGPCCNSDHRQGPETFIEPQVMGDDAQPVIWLVAELENDDRPGQQRCWVETVLEGGLPRTLEYPCRFGPRFEPLR